MEYIIPALVALSASVLTFFSGFGLGTILLPVFILFFPIELAVALTGIIHFSNNLLKASLFTKRIDIPILIKFGIPSIVGAYIGAQFLFYFPSDNILYDYEIFGKYCHVSLLKFIMGLLIVVFAGFELWPTSKTMTFTDKWLYTGGLFSGFFGGLSGHQGALRSFFLLNVIKDKERFIATGVVIACVVDISRIGVYFNNINKVDLEEVQSIFIVCLTAALVGVFVGKKMLTKVTISEIQKVVGVLLFLIGTLLLGGII
jgi:uncharacterized membrane protein YfcA